MRFDVLTQAATTDDRGRTRSRRPRSRIADPRVIAHAEGRPPALAHAPMPQDDRGPASRT